MRGNFEGAIISAAVVSIVLGLFLVFCSVGHQSAASNQLGKEAAQFWYASGDIPIQYVGFDSHELMAFDKRFMFWEYFEVKPVCATIDVKDGTGAVQRFRILRMTVQWDSTVSPTVKKE